MTFKRPESVCDFVRIDRIRDIRYTSIFPSKITPTYLHRYSVSTDVSILRSFFSFPKAGPQFLSFFIVYNIFRC